jgi:hypothetical protein
MIKTVEEVFISETPLSRIRQVLIEKGGLCKEVDSFFKDYAELTYGSIIERFKQAVVEDRVQGVSWMLNNLVLLGDRNSIEMNDGIIEILITSANDVQLLGAFKKFKNYTNISDKIKDDIIAIIRKNLPGTYINSEYTNVEGQING